MATLTVGAGQQYAHIADAVAAAQNGDIIAVQAGTYVNDFATIDKNLTIQGVGGMAHFTATGEIANGKGLFITSANVTFDHIEFSGGDVSDDNGAGIRFEGGNLTVTNCYFHDNEMHILGGPQPGSIVVSQSEFGRTIDSTLINHGVYAGRTDLLKVTDSYFHDTTGGHHIKSRAAQTIVENNRFDDGTGVGSYTVDIPEGGNGIIRGNTIIQAADNDNASIIHFGGEGTPRANSSLLVENNIIENFDRVGTAVDNDTTFTVSIVNNKFYNVPTVASGPNSQSGNTLLAQPVPFDTSHPWADTTRIATGDDKVTTNEDTPIVIDVLANDVGKVSALHLTSPGEAAHGTVSIGADGKLHYTPDANFNGSDSFTYTVSDGAASAAAIVTVTVAPVNDAPVARDDVARTAPGQAVVVDVRSNDSDVDGTTPTLAGFTQAAHGTVAQNANGTLTYTPIAGYTGADTFDYTITDGKLTDTAKVTLNVTASGSGMHDLLAAAQPGSWVQLNLNQFKDVWTPEAYRPDYDPAAVIFAWNAMAWDPNRNDLIFWGGGHANYGGNEVYRWDGDTLNWERASLPTASKVLDNYPHVTTVDGADHSPVASHSYDNNEFLPIADRFVTLGGAAWGSGGLILADDLSHAVGPFFWDPSKADANKVGGLTGSVVGGSTAILGGEMWENRDNIDPAGPGEHPGGSMFGFVDGTTAYAQENGKDVLYIGDAHLWKYTVNDVNDASKDTYEKIGMYWEGFAGQGAGALGTQQHVYVRTAADRFTYWDLTQAGPNNPNHNFHPTDASGQFDFSKLQYYGIDYDTHRGQFVMWGGGADVWILKPPAVLSPDGWTLTRADITASAGEPSLVGIQEFHGIEGKWKYVAEEDVFLGVIDPIKGTVWAYKPSDWAPSGYTPPPPPPPSTDLVGTAGADTLTGSAANERFTGGAGNDVLVGAGGTDTAVFAGLSTDYAITMGSTVTIKDLKPGVNGDDGTDSLSGIEKAQFSDRTVFLDGTNNAPLAVTDTASTNEDTVVTGKLLANDIDFDKDVLKATATTLTSAKGAAVTILADGSYTYDPHAAAALQALDTGSSVVDTFSYAVNDGRGGTATGAVQISVAGVTDATTPPTDPNPPTDATISGTAGNDRLSGGDSVNDVIDGKDGHDVLRGLSGNDTLRGGTGNDQLYGGTGDDKLEGGAGNDYLFADGGNDRLEGGAGNDYLHGGAGNDVFAFAKGFGSDLLDDFVAGQDKLDLSAYGVTSLSQLAAKASLVATSANTMSVDFGGGDKLTIYGVNKLTADSIVSGDTGGGGTTTPPTNATITGTAGEDRLSGKDSVNDVIDGKDGHDTLRGLSGNDTLRGGTGNDQLYGGTGDDRLEGGAGNDYLFADGGNDRLEGGTGNDLLHGGAGNDVFVFAKGFGGDLLDDFVAGQDKIDLSAFGLGGMSQLATKASLVATSANTMYVDFGSGDRLTIYGINKLTADNVVF